MDYYYNLDRIIREEIDKGKEIAIYPFGKVGMQAKEILEQRYGKKAILIDNKLAKYNSNIITIDNFLEKRKKEEVSIILCSVDQKVNRMLAGGAEGY